MIKVRQAGIGDLDALVPLFDAYRQFYKRNTDPPAAREFLFKRFQHQQSVIFIAHDDEGAAIGFTQLYPLFSSLTLVRTFVLYDLFVAPSARRTGAARQLLRAAADYGRAVGAGALELSTATDNVSRATPLRVRGVGARHRLLRLRARALAGPASTPTFGRLGNLPGGVVSILILPKRLWGIDHRVTARPWPRDQTGAAHESLAENQPVPVVRRPGRRRREVLHRHLQELEDHADRAL